LGPGEDSAARREFYTNLDPYVIKTFVDGKMKPVAFDLDDFFAAVQLGPYTAVCATLGLTINAECPIQLRRSLLDRMVASKAEAACRIASDSSVRSPPEVLSQCAETATRKLWSSLDTVLANDDQRLSPYKSLPTFADYESKTYQDTCDALSESAMALSSKEIEGNLWLQGGGEREAFLAALVAADASAAASWIYFEIGFNAGHSAAMVLSAFPRANIRSFDLCSHVYAIPNYELLRAKFKDLGGADRISLICGDSRQTLPQVITSLSDEDKADVIRVDGGHSFDVASSDLLNARRLAKRGALVLLDDCECIEVQAAWDFVVALGFIEPLRPGLGWRGSCHGHLR